MSKRQDITIDAECDYAVPVVITDNDDTTPLNLTGCSLVWGAFRSSGQVPLISKSTLDVAEINVTSAVDGEATIYFVPADTEDLGNCVYEHSLVVTDATDKVARIIRGYLTIVKI